MNDNLVIPDDANIDWWLEHQLSIMDESSKSLIKGLSSPKDMGRFHHGTGTAIRNHYGLWHQNGLTKFFNEEFEVYHGDDISSILLEALWHRIHDKEYDPQPTIERFKQHWEQMGCDMKGEKNA